MRGNIAWRSIALALIALGLVAAPAAAQGSKTDTTTPVVATSNGLTMGGSPFFPVIATTDHCLDQETVNANLNMGVNVFQDPFGCDQSTTATWPDLMDPLLKNKAWVYGTRPDSIQNLQDVPEDLDWPVNVRVVQNPMSLVGCGSQFDSSLPLYNVLKRASAKGPTLYWTVIASRGTLNSAPYCLTGAGMRNIALLSYMAGVDGIKLFNFIPEKVEQDPSSNGIDVRQDVQAALKQFSSCMTSLAAVRTGKNVAVSVDDPDKSVVARAWAYNGVTYLFVANTSKATTTATLGIPGKGLTKQTTCGTAASVKLTEGSVTKKFVPLEADVFKVIS